MKQFQILFSRIDGFLPQMGSTTLMTYSIMKSRTFDL